MSSKIEWTDETWNPITGCSKISPGCLNCYAERQALRRLHAYETGLPWNLANARKNVVLHPDRLGIPWHWERARRIFVCSGSDLFHHEVPDEFVDQVLAVSVLRPRHTFQLLTKRADRMFKYFAYNDRLSEIKGAVEKLLDPFPGQDYWDGDVDWPLQNIWVGVSAEDQRTFNNRAAYLFGIRAAVTFVSLEPLLGPIDFRDGPVYPDSTMGDWSQLELLDWVIVGGESGPRARPMDPRWVRSIRDQCKAADIPFFFKQWGEWKPVGAWGKAPEFARVGKKAAGRELDGVLYDAMPQVRTE